MDKHNHILIVDDNPSNLQVLHELLANNGYQVHALRDSRKVRDVLRAVTPDLILLDIHMPHKDGFEVAEILKSSPETSEIPIIFISASDAEEHIQQGFDMGGVDYITKPIRQNEVLARVSTHIRLRVQQLELEQKVSEIQRMRAQEEQHFTRIKALRNQFIESATHDLKNPLFTIMGYVDLIKDMGDELSTEQIVTFHEHIEMSTEKMGHLISDMLDLLRVDSVRVRLDLRSVRFGEYLAEKLVPLTMRASKKNITIKLKHAEDDFPVLIDVGLFERVLDNLISNAIKYSPEDTTVYVCYGNTADEFYLDVEDYGMGMSAEVIDKLFDPFFRSADVDSSNIEGTGLGMAITKRIIERHDGIITVQSKVNEGSLFRVSIPHKCIADAT